MNTIENIGDLVITKNNQFIAFNKPPSLGVQPDKTEDKCLLDLAEIYCKSKLNVLHRIDRPASGVVVFAKSRKALVELNRQFQSHSIQKTYLAIVKNAPPDTNEPLVHFVKKNQKLNRSFASNEEVPHSKKAILEYQLVDKIDNYTLLAINLITGRHHQIRAQLSAIDSPIRGDVKYGFKRGNRDRSIQLHAWKMTFQHPVTKEAVVIEAPLPDEPIWQAFNLDKIQK